MEGYDEDLDIKVKSDPVDRVTQVDIDAQNYIVSALKEHYPDHGIVGEEDDDDAGTADDCEYRWVIDPLDGTSNFIQRLPHVGTSIGLQRNKESILGVLYFPVYDSLYTGIQGQGAFLNGKPIHVSSCEKMSDAYIAEVFSDRTNRGKTVTFPPALAYRRFGSAVTSLAYLAGGNVHGTALRCFIWDIAAAEVIIKEAGGKVERWFKEENNERGPLTVIASIPQIFAELKEFTLKEHKKNP